MSSLAKFCVENSCFIVEPCISTAYPERILKYFDKGLDVILPDLDINKVPVKYFKYSLKEVLELPYCNVVLDGKQANKLFVNHLKIPDTMPTVVGDILEGKSEDLSDSFSLGCSICDC